MPSKRDKANQFLDKGIFGIFALAGATAIILLKSLGAAWAVVTGGPVALIIIYALLTASRLTRFRLRYDQAGDNCYYLGFIYTLVSLAVALYAFSGNSAVAVDQIVKDFGIALATTLVGVTLRVLLHQMREDPHDVEDAARRELSEAASRVTGHLGSMIRDVVALRAQTQDELKHFAYATKQVAEEHRDALKGLKNQSERLAKSVEGLVKKVEGVAISPDLLERKLDPAAERLAASVDGLVKKIDGITFSPDLLERKLEPAAQRLERVADTASRVAEDTHARLKDIATLAAQSANSLEKAASAGEILKELANLPTQISAALDQISVTTASMAEMQKGVVEILRVMHDTAAKLERLRDLDAVLDRIERLREAPPEQRSQGWFPWRRAPKPAE